MPVPSPADKTDRRWFITGGSGGLGRHLAEHALAHGDRVVATVRRSAALDDLRATYGDRLTVEILDVTRPAEVDAVIARTLAGGPVDIMVNNAGYGLVGATEEMTVEQIRDQVETLLLAPMLITRAFLTPMREQGGGRIIQISSMGGQVGSSVFSAYHAGKWGLEGFTEGVSREVAEFGIRFTIVEPGGTRTGFAPGLRMTNDTGIYRDTAVGRERRWLETAKDEDMTGDPAKLAAAIYDTTRLEVPPLRLTLGADAYAAVHAALTERLTALEAQKDVAASVAFTD
jgi:NAD(P)-dependent dehydrogenase (short-subunit alcohol dehydrogenase family)